MVTNLIPRMNQQISDFRNPITPEVSATCPTCISFVKLQPKVSALIHYPWHNSHFLTNRSSKLLPLCRVSSYHTNTSQQTESTKNLRWCCCLCEFVPWKYHGQQLSWLSNVVVAGKPERISTAKKAGENRSSIFFNARITRGYQI